MISSASNPPRERDGRTDIRGAQLTRVMVS